MVGLTQKRRVAALLLLFLLFALVLCGRLFWIQFSQAERLQRLAEEQWYRDIPLEAPRGTIRDRSGVVLAESVPVPTLLAVPIEIEDVDEAVRALAPLLAMDSTKLKELLTQPRALVYVRRKMDYALAEQVRALHLKGFYLTEESRRVYPNGNLASHLLGFTGIDSQGLEGLELYYDDLLQGGRGSIAYQTDSGGRNLPFGGEIYSDPELGNDLLLSIDSGLQQIVETALQKSVAENKARSASAIMMNPHNGEILAMASYPDYDPNRFADYPSELWRNPIVSDAFEPGSTFKIVTAAAGLQEQVVYEGEYFYDPGFSSVSGVRLHCWKTDGHGSQTFTEAVMNSCNPVFVTIGQRLGTERLFGYLRRFGFGYLTGIDLYGEAAGIVFSEDQVGPVELATTAFGQGPAVTPLQQIVAMAAIANGGYIVQPHLLAAVEPKDEAPQFSLPQDYRLRQVLEEDTAARMREIMKQVLNGQISKAASELYWLGGKTGTAQKIRSDGPGYEDGNYVASTIGFGPVEQPQIVLYIYVDEPKGSNGYYGGQVAAPVFREIMDASLQYLQIQPDRSEAVVDTVPMPSFIGKTRAEAEETLANWGLTPVWNGQGWHVVEQLPPVGSVLRAGQQVMLTLGD